MFSCRECGKEFEDWHALGGHMRTHRPQKGGEGTRVAAPRGAGGDRVGRALGKLSELGAEEAWRIVVHWIMDVQQEAQGREDAIVAHRVRLEESEARMDGIQGELRKLQQLVSKDSRVGPGPENTL